jgi:Regulator of chromosome condensation (RCC1) repeat
MNSGAPGTLESRSGGARRLFMGPLAVGSALLALSASAALTAPSGAQAAWVTWGSDVGGILGTGYASFTPALTPVGVLPAPSGLVAGKARLMTDGTVRGWGENSSGQIGDGTRQRKLNPITVPGLTGVTQIAGSAEHMIALLSDGTVKTWGSNLSGELGIGTIARPHGEGCLTNCRSLVPISVPGLAGVVAVFAGGADDAALLNTGAVVAWGENLGGQLGDGTEIEKDVPTRVRRLSGARTLALGGAYTLGGHMLALLNDGTVKAVGSNPQGQLGIGSTVSSSLPVKVRGLSGVTAISASWTHSLALAGGKLLAWGNNSNGELGVRTRNLCGVVVKSAKPCATRPVAVPLDGVRSADAGYAFSVVAAGGHDYSTGHNNLGQLGDGNKIDRRSFGLVSGLEGVQTVLAGGISASAEIAGPAPPPIIEAVPGPGSLKLRWQATGGSGWIIASRLRECCLIHHTPPFGAKTELPAAARSYAFTGKPGQPYEVAVQQKHGSFGMKVVEGTPQSTNAGTGTGMTLCGAQRNSVSRSRCCCRRKSTCSRSPCAASCHRTGCTRGPGPAPAGARERPAGSPSTTPSVRSCRRCRPTP